MCLASVARHPFFCADDISHDSFQRALANHALWVFRKLSWSSSKKYKKTQIKAVTTLLGWLPAIYPCTLLESFDNLIRNFNLIWKEHSGISNKTWALTVHVPFRQKESICRGARAVITDGAYTERQIWYPTYLSGHSLIYVSKVFTDEDSITQTWFHFYNKYYLHYTCHCL